MQVYPNRLKMSHEKFFHTLENAADQAFCIALRVDIYDIPRAMDLMPC